MLKLFGRRSADVRTTLGGERLTLFRNTVTKVRQQLFDRKGQPNAKLFDGDQNQVRQTLGDG